MLDCFKKRKIGMC